MKRAATERPRTYHAWRQHHDRHAMTDSAVGGQNVVGCVCDEQVGRFRKRKRFGCGKPRCYLCHGEKLLGKPTCRTSRMYDAINLQDNQ